jgi:hypothetical protein
MVCVSGTPHKYITTQLDAPLQHSNVQNFRCTAYGEKNHINYVHYAINHTVSEWILQEFNSIKFYWDKKKGSSYFHKKINTNSLYTEKFNPYWSKLFLFVF